MNSPVRVIKPGDPEFAEIAKTILPIHRVHNSSYTRTTFYNPEELSAQGGHIRREDVDKL
jgi:hypothetical protein